MLIQAINDIKMLSYRMYCKQGKISWAKLLWIPPNEVVHKKLLQYLMFKVFKQCHYKKLV